METEEDQRASTSKTASTSRSRNSSIATSYVPPQSMFRNARCDLPDQIPLKSYLSRQDFFSVCNIRRTQSKTIALCRSVCVHAISACSDEGQCCLSGDGSCVLNMLPSVQGFRQDPGICQSTAAEAIA